jgi:hypothetical protein
MSRKIAPRVLEGKEYQVNCGSSFFYFKKWQLVEVTTSLLILMCSMFLGWKSSLLYVNDWLLHEWGKISRYCKMLASHLQHGLNKKWSREMEKRTPSLFVEVIVTERILLPIIFEREREGEGERKITSYLYIVGFETRCYICDSVTIRQWTEWFH